MCVCVELRVKEKKKKKTDSEEKPEREWSSADVARVSAPSERETHLSSEEIGVYVLLNLEVTPSPDAIICLVILCQWACF